MVGVLAGDGDDLEVSPGRSEDPAAIRLAILAHHYRSDWSWTDEGFAEAKVRLRTWRAAVELAPAGSAAPLLAQMRAALSEDLNAPGALAAVDAWAATALAGTAAASAADAALVGDAVDALLGVEL